MNLPGRLSLQVVDLVNAIYLLAQGGSNSVGTVTLTESATTTTVSNAYMSPTSKVILSPTTANAAAAIGGTYVSTKSKGEFVLTHANNAQSDRTFDYEIRGN
jgi:hypothetical protein